MVATLRVKRAGVSIGLLLALATRLIYATIPQSKERAQMSATADNLLELSAPLGPRYADHA
jgi:hypothetical protein